MLATSLDIDDIRRLKQQVSKKFDMKDLGSNKEDSWKCKSQEISIEGFCTHLSQSTSIMFCRDLTWMIPSGNNKPHALLNLMHSHT